MKTLRIEIHGDVQGVFFRDGAQRLARKLGLRGWVTNRPDGTVEAVACGEKAALDEFLAFCRRGPSSASVSEVKAVEIEGCTDTDFSIR